MFAKPLFFFGLSSIPVLILIYLLRNLYRKQPVSNISFWLDTRSSCSGGQHVSRFNSTILFFIELLIIILLVTAAAEPLLNSPDTVTRYVFILDDSFSMISGSFHTPRERALAKISELLDRTSSYEVSLISGSAKPSIILNGSKEFQVIRGSLQSWKCMSNQFNVNASLALASKIAGNTGKILVLSDKKAPVDLPEGRIKWLAFGEKQNNTAFIDAVCSSAGDQEKFLIQVANLSDSRTEVEIEITSAGNQTSIERLQMEGGSTRHFSLLLKTSDTPARAVIKSADSGIDNVLWLVRSSKNNLNVKVDVQDEVLSYYLKNALSAIDLVTMTSSPSDIVFTDTEREPYPDPVLNVEFRKGKDVSGFIGPFITFPDHDLCRGLHLDGVVWAASTTPINQGNPLILAGNTPLLSLFVNAKGSKSISLNLDSRNSTLLRTVNWPIMISNILEYKRNSLPGLERPIYALGSTVRIRTALPGAEAVLELPDKTKVDLRLGEFFTSFPDQAGIYKLKVSDHESYMFSVNPLSMSESDLRDSCSGEWGEWNVTDIFWWQYRPVGWMLILAALVLLGFHRWLSRREEHP